MTGKNLLWILPFFFFIAGYCITRSFFHVTAIETPSVVGKHLYEAFSILSNNQLTIQLLDQKEDADLPDSTVLSQIPSPGQHVKPRQTVFLALSKQPAPLRAPSIQGKQLAEIELLAKATKIRLKTYFLESVYPHNSCIAQIPAADAPLPDNTMTVYIAKSDMQHIIWPNFSNKPLAQVVEFLEEHSITPQVIAAFPNQQKEGAMVIDQRPLAGSIVSLDKKHLPIVQLFIR